MEYHWDESTCLSEASMPTRLSSLITKALRSAKAGRLRVTISIFRGLPGPNPVSPSSLRAWTFSSPGLP